jgi:acetyltransferase-like isoleucine patch superfamily enzyme
VTLTSEQPVQTDRPQPQTLELLPLRPGLVRRALGKLVRVLRWYVWNSRLGAIGDRSHIDSPAYVVGGKGIRLGSRVQVWRNARLEALPTTAGQGTITLEDDVMLQPYAHLAAVKSVQLGRGVMCGSHVYISDHDHDFANPDEPAISNNRVIAAPVAIGDYTWLGENVVVLKGVEIGEHCVIGAGSIVTRSIPPYSVAVGAPARVVRRFDHQQKRWVKAEEA